MKNVAYQILIYLIILIFSIYYFKSAIPFIEHQLNLDYIIENFCVNKDKPVMQCNGKCHLKKQIKKAEKEEKEKKPFLIKDNILLYISFINQTELNRTVIDKDQIYICRLINQDFFKSLLKPPEKLFS